MGQDANREISRLSIHLSENPRNIALAADRGRGVALCMAKRAAIQRDENVLRTAILRFMKDRELKPTPWAEKAKVPESTFRSFLNGKAHCWLPY